MSKNRVQWIDTMKFYCILFVMISHVGNNNDISPTFLSTFYSCFFLTGFLFASGYTYSNKHSFFQHLKHKTVQLLLPWALYSYLIILFNNLVTRHPENHNLWKELLDNTLQIRRIGDEMWFVLALFVAYIPFFFVAKIYEKNRDRKNAETISIIASILMLFLYYAYKWYVPAFSWGNNNLPWHIEYIPYAISFMLLGFVFKDKLETVFDSVATLSNMFIVFPIFMLIIYSPYLFNYTISSWIAETVFSIVKYSMGLWLLIAVCKHQRSNCYISFVGKNTLNYFGLHRYTNNIICNYITPLLFPLDTVREMPVLAAVYAISVGVIESVLLILPCHIINRYIPVLTGKGFSKRGRR